SVFDCVPETVMDVSSAFKRGTTDRPRPFKTEHLLLGNIRKDSAPRRTPGRRRKARQSARLTAIAAKKMPAHAPAFSFTAACEFQRVARACPNRDNRGLARDLRDAHRPGKPRTRRPRPPG